MLWIYQDSEGEIKKKNLESIQNTHHDGLGSSGMEQIRGRQSLSGKFSALPDVWLL